NPEHLMGAPSVKLEPRREDEPSSLLPSFNQERDLVFAEWFRETGAPYRPFHIVECVRISGGVNARSLETSLNKIIGRHAALRTSFLPTPGVPPVFRAANLLISARTGIVTSGLYQQCIATSAYCPVRAKDLSALPLHEQNLEIQRLLTEESEPPFDYRKPPLMRALLLKLATTEHLLTVIIHHLVSDMISQRIFRRELRLFYEESVGGLCSLPELLVHYPDFAAWQHKYLDSGIFAHDIRYWKRQWFAAESAQVRYTETPERLRKSTATTFTAGFETLILAPEISAELRASAKRLHVTLYTFFLASLLLVLRRWVQRNSVAVWVNFANRRLPETQNVIGWFVHAHLLHVEIGPSQTGHALLRDVARAVLESARHAHVPATVAWRALKRPPRFTDLRIAFDLYTEEGASETVAASGRIKFERLPGVVLRRFRNPVGLEVLAVDGQPAITLAVGFDLGKFSSEGIQEILRSLQNASITLATRPEDQCSTERLL
ncbi:MAG TPA: condensation domain-containing protein, partial [Bryobacteraceae bacterium]|nr:condensation domain-containing protein [Bryobacteraceae bacterium]